MDNLIESLLGLDDKEFNNQRSKDVEIPRLTKLIGKPFNVTIKSLSPERIYELQDGSLDKKGAVSMNRFYKGAINICSECITSPNFDDEKLKKKLGLNERCLRIEVLKKVFKVSEINIINSECMSISGFDDNSEVVEELKND